MEGSHDYYVTVSAQFGSTYTKIGMMQRRSAWSLCRDDTQVHEAFCIFSMRKETFTQVHLKYSESHIGVFQGGTHQDTY